MIRALLTLITSIIYTFSFSQSVTWCGEAVPINNDYVKLKLIQTIRKNKADVLNKRIQKRILAYTPYISKIIKSYGLPEDLKFIPMVESRFNNLDVSHAGAVGMWQVMPEVGTDDGMYVDASNDGIDDRNNWIKATHTACRWWKRYYPLFHNWTLLAAAWNWGQGNLLKAIRNQGTKNYYQLHLNKETASYVYELLSFKILYRLILHNKLNEFIKNNVDGKSSAEIAEQEAKIASVENSTSFQIPTSEHLITPQKNGWNSSGWNSNPESEAQEASQDKLLFTKDSVFVYAFIANTDEIRSGGTIYLALYKPQQISNTVISPQKLIKGLVYGKEGNRLLIDIAGIDISRDLSEYSAQVTDLAGQPGLLLNQNSHGTFYIPHNLRVKIKFKNY